ncbi:MAG: hypothetical protein ABIF40_03770 [archaeon]
MEFEIKPCKTKGAIKAQLKHNTKLDFKKIKSNFEIIVETPVALIIKEENVEIMVQKYGDLTFKNCKDEVLIEKIAKKIYKIALNNKTKP